MSTVILACRETPGLHLGPGVPGSRDCIDFEPQYAGPGKPPVVGYARLDTDDPRYAAKMGWTKTFGCPAVEILAPEDVPLAPGPDTELCPGGCGRVFEDRFATNAHLIETHCKPAVPKE